MREKLLNGNHTCCKNATKAMQNSAKVGDYKGIRGLAKCPNADFNEQDMKGRTALYLAAWMGHLDAVNALLDLQNIDVNKGILLTGETAYSIASKKSHFDVMKTLSQHGNVDVNEGWINDSWTTTYGLKQKFFFYNLNLSSNSRVNGSKVTRTSKLIVISPIKCILGP